MFFPSHVRVFLATGYTDMRKSINGLSILVAQHLEMNPLSGHLFVFCNKRQNMVTILYWARIGFCLCPNRLEKQFFRWPKEKTDLSEIDHRQLSWLLEGLQINQNQAHNILYYSTVF